MSDARTRVAAAFRGDLLLPGVVFVALLLLPAVITADYSLGRYQLILLYAMLAVAMNFQWGIGGQFVLSQAAVMGIAAYATGVLSASHGWEAQYTLPASIGAAIVANVITSLPALRLTGWYLALATLFATVVFPDVVALGPDWLGGQYGLGGVAPLTFFGHGLSGVATFELVVVSTALSWLLVRNLVESGWGTLFGGLRDSPLASQSLGIHLIGVKLRIYALTGIPLGLAGGLAANIDQYVTAQSYGVHLTELALAAILLGGQGTLWGPVIGTAILQGISFFFDPFSPYNALFLGGTLIVTRIMMPSGLVGTAELALGRLRRSGHGTAPERVSDEAVSLPAAVRPSESRGSGLRVSGLEKQFTGNVVLRGVDLAASGGEIVTLLGANGSGKTTLINVVTGFLRADGGVIEVDGRRIDRLTPAGIADAGMRRTFQVPRLVNDLSARRNVELGQLGARRPSLFASVFRTPAFKRSERERADMAVQVCEWLGIDSDTIARPAGELPLGLKRIVEIGRAVIGDPTVVCLDEPAAGLNVQEIERLGSALRQLADAGMTVLLVEHNVRFVMDVSDRVYLLANGVVAAHTDLRVDEPLPAALAEYISWAPDAVVEEDPLVPGEGRKEEAHDGV